MKRLSRSHNVRGLLVPVLLLTGCSILGDFGSFEDEPVGDGDLAAGDGDGDAGDGDGDGDAVGDGDGDLGGDGDGDTVGDGDGDLAGDGDGDSGGTSGDGDGDGDGDMTNGSGGAGTGGADDTGSGGAETGGAPGTGGNDMGTGGAIPMSPGCGAADPPTSGTYTISVQGVETVDREYILDVPADYDSDTPYPITFAMHPNTPTAAGGVVDGDFYNLKSEANGEMIFVAPEGISNNWANTNGRDVEMIAQTLDRLEAELCIDTDRVFSVGFSAGGMFTNALGCALGDRFRAIVSYSGALYFGCVEGTNPVAYLGTHGTNDSVIPPGEGEDARDVFRLRNGCSNTTVPYGSSGCVQYEGCVASDPVVWCEFTGDHLVPGFAAGETWTFLSQF